MFDRHTEDDLICWCNPILLVVCDCDEGCENCDDGFIECDILEATSAVHNGYAVVVMHFTEPPA